MTESEYTLDEKTDPKLERLEALALSETLRRSERKLARNIVRLSVDTDRAAKLALSGRSGGELLDDMERLEKRRNGRCCTVPLEPTEVREHAKPSSMYRPRNGLLRPSVVAVAMSAPRVVLTGKKGKSSIVCKTMLRACEKR